MMLLAENMYEPLTTDHHLTLKMTSAQSWTKGVLPRTPLECTDFIKVWDVWYLQSKNNDKNFKILYDTWENIKYSLHSNDPRNKYCVNYMKTKKNNYPLTSTQNGTIALDHSQNTRPPEDKSSRHYTERDFSPAKLKGKCHKQHLIIWLVNLLTA